MHYEMFRRCRLYEIGSAMGRPPIGKIAMTAAERMRRFRAKFKAEPPPKPSDGSDALAQLRGEIARLTTENEEARAHVETQMANLALRQQVDNLRRKLEGA